MRVKNKIVIVLMALVLQSCASPKMSEELEAGKLQFSTGNYKVAFHRLLPIAVYGKKEAEYAVGYMYYYGMGVSQDSESGLFWMNKAADQHYKPAEDALRMIRDRGEVPIHAKTNPALPTTSGTIENS